MALCQQSPPKSQLENRQAANRTTAIIVPALLVGIVGYATWVVIVLLSAHYLIHPHGYNAPNPRPGAGIAIIVLYFVLLIPMAICYIRLLVTVRHPGYIPKGEPTAATPFKPEETPERNVQRSCTNTTVKDDSKPKASPQPQGPPVTTLDTKAIFDGKVPPPPGTERFYSKEVFVCDPNGLPIWCGTCCNWKSDRAHHGSDVGRCVLKLDHFCPWVGGVVGERNFNFFIQFNSYAALYSLFVLIVMAIFVAEIKHAGGVLDVNWIVALALAAVFTLFTGGMALNSIALVLKNLTTIDNIGHQRGTMHLAVLVDGLPPTAPSTTASLNGSRPSENPLQGTITYPLHIDPATQVPPPPRTFAILRTHPGMNPWNLGAYRNFKSIMGEHWYDWFVPLRHSPACNHDRDDSMYELGPDVDRLKADAGLGERKRRRRKSRHVRDDSDDIDIMGSTLANVNGITGRERSESLDSY